MNQSKQVASLTTSRLSPLAKPFTLNRSPYQSTSYLSPKPDIYSLDHFDDDPFSSLLDSFRKSNLGCSKVHSLPLDDYDFCKNAITATLPVETGSQTVQKSLLEQHPSLELSKNGDFDGLDGSLFDVSMPLNSSCVTGNEVDHGKQRGDLLGDVGSSVSGDGSMLHKGKLADDKCNPCLTVSDGIFEKNTGTVVAKDILLNSEGIIPAADESSSFLSSNGKIAPLKLSATDMSHSKSISQNKFSNNLGDSDPEVDSPCWKGTMAYSLTPSEISGSVDAVQVHHVEKATEKHNSLNPLAPQFFPGIGYVKDGFLSSNSSVPVAASLSSGKGILMKPVMAEPSLELNKGVELQHSSNICGRENAFNVINDPKSSCVDPVLNAHCTMSQSTSKEEDLTSKGKLVTIVDADDFAKGTKNPTACWSVSEVFPAKGHSPASAASSSQVDVVTDLFKEFKGASKSLIESPKPDVKIMVHAMHVLSELLVQSRGDGVDSFDEHDPDMIMISQIINNLNDFSSKKCGQRISTFDSTHADSALCSNRSLKLPKGLEMTIEALTVPNQLYLQNDYMGKNTVSKLIGQSGQSSFASSSDEGTKKGNEIAQLQVIRRSLGKNLDFDKRMEHPDALLFWNLWLDSEAERCYKKYKTYHCLMEAGVDVNCTNVAELLR